MIIDSSFGGALEIIEQLKNGVMNFVMLSFTLVGSVYNFSKVCYELIMGCTPFEACTTQDYDFIFDGNKLVVPVDLHLLLESIVVDCWQGCYFVIL